jgi:hypothetical protein
MIQNGDQGKAQAKLWINIAFNGKQTQQINIIKKKKLEKPKEWIKRMNKKDKPNYE